MWHRGYAPLRMAMHAPRILHRRGGVSAYGDGRPTQDTEPVDLPRWVALAEGVLAAEGVATGELTLAFVDEADMAELNQEHMGEAYATDVLSFPIDADLALGGHDPREPDGQPLLLGDVVVCPRVAATNAPAHAGDVDDELALLVVHGVLHVLGVGRHKGNPLLLGRLGRYLLHDAAHPAYPAGSGDHWSRHVSDGSCPVLPWAMSGGSSRQRRAHSASGQVKGAHHEQRS